MAVPTRAEVEAIIAERIAADPASVKPCGLIREPCCAR
jgi:hypothetical protein